MLRDQLGELLAPVVAGLGYELWELEFAPRSGGGLLRLYIDSAARRHHAGGLRAREPRRQRDARRGGSDPGPLHAGGVLAGLDRVLRTQEHSSASPASACGWR